jgi:ketosteroid isomerase-like protein
LIPVAALRLHVRGHTEHIQAYYVEHIHAYYDAVDDGRIDDLLALFADDVVYERPGRPRIEGKEDLEAFYRRERPLSEGCHELHDLLADDDQVAVRGTYSGVQDGADVELGFADVHVFDANGLITERFTYTDRDTI